MIRPWFSLRVMGALLATAIIAVASTAPAGADSGYQRAESLDPVIEYALIREPGGVVVDDTKVVWPQLGMTLTVSRVVPMAATTKCPTGLICAFDGSNETGTRLTWATCAVHSTAALAIVRSVASARPVNSAQARNGTTVLATAGAGNFANVYGTVTNIRCL